MKAVAPEISFPRLEEDILAYWRERQIFEQSMRKDAPLIPADLCAKHDTPPAPRPEYVFYDGPPFATGLPHYGHLLAGTIKDVVGRFFTMKGFHVDRRFGWDCHGVPVEFEIQKSLDLHGSKAIKEFGIGAFNEECRKIVLRYTEEWKEFVERSGRWVDFNRQYRTMDVDYMESIWWVVKSLWDRGLIYEGFKCVPYSWAINTPLSNFEANLNYKTVQDPAIAIRFLVLPTNRIFSEAIAPHVGTQTKVYCYAWTTTPWTLPSNMALAVGEDIGYSLVLDKGKDEAVILATNLVGQYFPAAMLSGAGVSVDGSEAPSMAGGADCVGADCVIADCVIVKEFSGSELVGLEYEPLFPYFAKHREQGAFAIYAGSFVTAEDGTGIVHLASFGEDDLGVFLEHGIPVVDPVDEDGNFTGEVPDYAGRNVKECDADILKALKMEGKIVSHKTIEHTYPFCWRTDTPLIYKSISSWFVRVESIREQLQHLNSTIHWVPENLRDGRMGKWLEGARDWAISRNRFWGTPLPIWRCQGCQCTECIGSRRELEEKCGVSSDDLHRHYIDGLEWTCRGCGGVMRRIPEVLDCWFESGSMPYAQAHYPFKDKEQFERNFPADFIAEGLDQTRGWFYTLEVLSTALFGRPAFRNVIVNGIVLAADGKKMSKSLKNYPPPEDIFGEYGADAMRLYLLSSAACRAEELRFDKRGVKDVVRQHLLPLWNAYNFFVTYGIVDGYTPELMLEETSPNLLDRWIVSKLASLIKGVDQAISNYHLYAATQPILDFVEQLTNWYIRLNRRRFWSDGSLSENLDKLHAYSTLHRVLLSFTRVLAPLAPFISEEIFLNLAKGVKSLECESVHLTSFPRIEEYAGFSIDTELEKAMEIFEEVILLGRTLRNDTGLKVRQPLRSLTVIHPDETALKLLRILEGYIKEELNIKHVVYTTEESSYVELEARLNTKELGRVLGPKLGSDGMAKLRGVVEGMPTAQLLAIDAGETVEVLGVHLRAGDIILKRKAKGGQGAVLSSGKVTISLDTTVDEELLLEGLSREFINRVQRLRKQSGFEVTDRILVRYVTAHNTLSEAIARHRERIMGETLATVLEEVKPQDHAGLIGNPGIKVESQEIDEKPVIIGLSVAL